MKKQVLIQLIGIACLILTAKIASPLSVVDGPHNFSPDYATTFIGSSKEICIYCHTPHGGVLQDHAGNKPPLWNRTLNDSTDTYFTMYSSPTFNATYATGRPTGPSLLCLSCHDGVSTLGGVLNYSGDPITFNYKNLSSFPYYADSKIMDLGQDLSNDHPISFEYDTNLVNADKATNGDVVGLKLPSVVKTENPSLKFYGSSKNRLECTTCHDAHDWGSDATPSKQPFLRMNNENSAMCLACHIK